MSDQLTVYNLAGHPALQLRLPMEPLQLRLSTEVADALAHAQTILGQLIEPARAVIDQLVRLMDRQSDVHNDPVHVAGLEARYYVRAAMDPAYATPEGLRLLRRRILTGTTRDLVLLSDANRRLVLVSALAGWETRGEQWALARG